MSTAAVVAGAAVVEEVVLIEGPEVGGIDLVEPPEQAASANPAATAASATAA